MRRLCRVYALSGLLSLGYQVAWFRIFVDAFGSTNLTFALVLCNFIGGLGAGALASGWITRRIETRLRLGSPLRVYGLVELLIAATVLLTPLVTAVPAGVGGTFPYVLEDGVHHLTLACRLVTVGLGIACIFVPCFLMGVTFPLLCHAFGRDARFPSLLYAWNTLGAATGVLACEFVLLPTLGHEWTLIAFAVVNAALGALFLVGSPVPVPSASLPTPPPAPPAPSEAATAAAADTLVAPIDAVMRPGPLVTPGVLLVCAIISGLVTGCLEADVYRRLLFLGGSADIAMSFISFWAILGIFTGSTLVRARPRLRFGVVRLGVLAGVALYGLAWWQGFWLRDAVAYPLAGRGVTGLLVLSGLFVFPAFALVSLLLPYVCNGIQAGRRHLGRAYGLNTVAFCAGITGFTWGAPYVNAFYALRLALVVCAVLAVSLLLLRAGRALPRWHPYALGATLAVAALLTPREFAPGCFPPATTPAVHPVRAMMSNGAQTTFIVEEPAGDVLYFTHHPMSGTSPGSIRYMRLMAHVPLMAHPAPRTALLICFGVGNTASAIACHETIERIDVVDLNPNVFRTAPEFADTNHDVIDDPRVRLIHDDGRHFLDRTDGRYDLVTSEPPPPRHAGVARLYSRECYDAVRDHLTPLGMMTQWLPVYQMSPKSVDLAVGTFLDVFPHALLFTGNQDEFVLVGSGRPIDLANIEHSFAARTGVRRDLLDVRIDRPLQILARIVQGDATLRRHYAGGTIITDRRNDFSRCIVSPHAPSIAYDPRAVAAEIGLDRLVAGPGLERTLGDLRRLVGVVPDFPVASLMTVRYGDSRDVAGADVDWIRAKALVTEAAIKLVGEGSDAALPVLARALDAAPGHPTIIEYAARALHAAGNAAAALEGWERLVRMIPDAPHVHAGWAETLLALGRPDEAVAAARRAADIAPEWAPGHRIHADARLAAGDVRGAREAYEAALALDADDEAARVGLAAAAARAGAATD